MPRGKDGEYRSSCIHSKLGTTWRRLVKATPRWLYPVETDPVHMVRQNGRAPGPVWTCVHKAKSLASTRFRTPNTQARSGLLYRLRYPGPILELRTSEFLGSLPKPTREHVLNGIMKTPSAASGRETVTRVSRKDGQEKWRKRSELYRTFREHLSMRDLRFSQRSVIQSFCDTTSCRLVSSYRRFGESAVPIIRVWTNQNGRRFIVPVPKLSFNMIISAQIFDLASWDNQTK